MAKRKNKDEGLLGLLIYTTIFIIFVALISAPIVFILLACFYGYGFLKQRNQLNGDYSDFWLNSEEKQQYKDNMKQFNHAHSQISQAHQVAKTNQIGINKDGSYSKRSKLGKQICQLLDTYQPIVDESKQVLDLLTHQPYQNWLSFQTKSIKKSSSIRALFIWLLAFIGVCLYNQLHPFGTFLDYITLQSENHILFAIAGLASIIGFFLNYAIQRQSLSDNFTPQPPLVDSDNIDTY
jgi:hypothetical protein